MGHYPIKCIRCAHILSNETVQFNTNDVVIGMSDILGQNNKTVAKPAEKSVKRGMWDTPEEETKAPAKKKSIWDEDDDSEQGGETKKSVTELSPRMTLDEIVQYCDHSGFDLCRPKWQKVTVTSDFKDVESEDEDLLIGVSFQKEKGGAMVSANRRYCPVCGCELPKQSGSMPTYNVSLMGTSSSGKTVYLCALNWLLSQGQGTLPMGGNLSCVPVDDAQNDLVQRSKKLFRKGVLPGTTIEMLNEPLSFQMTFQVGGKLKRCLLAITDMKGEDVLSSDGINLETRGEYFSRADAFMFIISPLDMPYIGNILPELSHNDGANVHQEMMTNLTRFVLPHFDDGQVAAPCTIMLSKCDILKNNVARLGIPHANSVVSPEIPPALRYTKDYFVNQDAGARQITSCDSPLYSFIQSVFKRCYFTSCSSLGANINIIQGDDGQIVENPNLLRPIRVADPVIYLLISLGFLPKYHMMVAGEKFRKQNEKIMLDWMNEHL